MSYANVGQFELPYFRTILTAIASVGWYIIAIMVGFWYAFPYISEKYTKWKLRKDEQDYAAKYHKNPDLSQERLSALEVSRQKMQEEYDQKCIVVQEKGKQEKKKSKSMRGEYNPLMGDGSRGYRPPKRSRYSKGCCG